MNQMCADARWLITTVITVTATAAFLLAEGDSQSARFLADSRAAMTKMMAAMDAKPTGDVDADFAAMMIAHHTGAIEMAQAELRAGRNEQLRRLAQEIIVTQQQEIEVMRLALTHRAHSAAAALTPIVNPAMAATPARRLAPAKPIPSAIEIACMPRSSFRTQSP